MAPFVEFPSGVQSNVRFLWNGQQCENVFHFDRGEAAFGDVTSQIGAAIVDDWWAVLRDVVSNDCSLVEIYHVDLASQTGPVATTGAGLTPAGGVLTDSVPNNVTFSVCLRTNKRGRSFRGRSYVVGLAAGNVVVNEVPAPARATIVEAYEALRTISLTNGIPLCVASRFSLGAPRTVGILTPITEIALVDNFVDSQRRRLPGRGT